MGWSLPETINIAIGVVFGSIIGGLITFCVSRFYYKRSIEPAAYLNGILTDMSEETARQLLRVLDAESLEHEEWTTEFSSEDLYSPLFRVEGYASPDDSNDGVLLELTPLGRLAALAQKERLRLEALKKEEGS